MPGRFADVAILSEPLSIVEKAIEQRWPGLVETVITCCVAQDQFGAADLDQPRELTVVVDVNGSRGLAHRLT